MDSTNNIWDKSQHIVLLYSFSTIDELLKLNVALKAAFSKDKRKVPQVIVIVNSKRELNHVPTITGFSYIKMSDISMFGRLKTTSLEQVLGIRFDLLVCLFEKPKKISKWMEKQFKGVQKAGVNMLETSGVDINVNTTSKSLKEIINFAKNTLQKIS